MNNKWQKLKNKTHFFYFKAKTYIKLVLQFRKFFRQICEKWEISISQKKKKCDIKILYEI